MSHNRLFLTIFLDALGGLPPLAFDMTLPAQPLIQKALEVAPAEVGLTLSVFLFGFSAAPTVFGPLSDSFGRHPLLIFGTAIFAGASIGSYLAQVSWITAVQGFAPAIAPALGSEIIAVSSWCSIFSLLAVIGGILFLLTLTQFRESSNRITRRLDRTALIQTYVDLARHPLWPEQYPTRMRATAFAFNASVGRFIGPGVNFVLGAAIHWQDSLGVPVAWTAAAFALGARDPAIRRRNAARRAA
jgi:MFS family permease